MQTTAVRKLYGGKHEGKGDNEDIRADDNIVEVV